MEQIISTFLTNAGCDLISITNIDSENPIVKYDCECANTFEKSWESVKNNPKCTKCMKDYIIDHPTAKMEVEKRGMKFIRAEQYVDLVKIIFVCKYDENEISTEFNDFMSGKIVKCSICAALHKADARTNVDHEAYVKAREERKDKTTMLIIDTLEKKGHTFVRRYNEGVKKRIKVIFKCGICNSGNETERYWETIKRANFSGCDSCSSQARTTNMTATMSNPEHKKEVSDRLQQKYGVKTTLALESVQQKRDETIMKKFGVDNVSKSPLIKQKKAETLKSNYGDNPYSSGSIICEKKKETVMNRYGVENVSQSPLIRVRQQKYLIYTSPSGKQYSYQGNEHYALKKLIEVDKYDENKIKTEKELCESGEMPEFEYVNKEGKNAVYFPDMRLENDDGTFTFVEVKSETNGYEKNIKRKIEAVRSKGYSIILWVVDSGGGTKKKVLHRPDVIIE